MRWLRKFTTSIKIRNRRLEYDPFHTFLTLATLHRYQTPTLDLPSFLRIKYIIRLTMTKKDIIQQSEA